MTRQILPVANHSKSYWRSDLHPLDAYRSTEELPAECDIAIIGAGMSGVATAYHLLKLYEGDTKPSIVLLDAREICSGATGRNGGHIKIKTDSMLNFKKKHGVALTEELVDFVNDHIDAVKAVVEEEGLECEFELRRSFDIFLDGEQGESAKQDFLESRKNGESWTKRVTLLPQSHIDEVTSLHKVHTAFSGPACSFWPYKFVTELLSRIAPKINIQTHTPVTHIRDSSDNVSQVLITHRGDLLARKVILATNAYTPGISPLFSSKIVPYFAQCSHLSPSPSFLAPHLSNTYNITYDSRGTDYLNPRPDGGIVVGGAKWLLEEGCESLYGVWDDSVVLDQPREHFDGLMTKYFRGWEKSGAGMDMLWSGIIGTTSDGLPFIGKVPGKEGKVYVIAGFNGGGMPLIYLSAKGLAKIVKEDVEFGETGIPGLFEVTKERLGL